MNIKYPLISIIIPVKPGRNYKTVLASIKRLAYPLALIEVWLSFGSSPSRQRNKAAQKSKGQILYFLDNDSEIDKNAFKRAAAIFRSRPFKTAVPGRRGFSFFPQSISQLITQRFFSRKIYKGEIGAIGGPNVWLEKETLWQSILSAVLESFFVHFLMAARYRPIGPVHRASEKELILCNLAVRKNVFKKVGGFNEVLYPNEENEFLNRVEKAGYQLVYSPGVLVRKPRRKTLAAVVKAFFHYGRGRLEQIKIEGMGNSLGLLVPLFFLFYLLSLFYYHLWYWRLLLWLYLLMAFGSSLGYAQRRRKIYLTFILPPLFLLAHLTYALGMICGLLTNLEKKKKKGRKGKIKLIQVKSFVGKWKNGY